MKTPIYWLKAKKYLSEKDKELSRIIKPMKAFYQLEMIHSIHYANL